MLPGEVFVVERPVSKAAMKDAYESVAEGAKGRGCGCRRGLVVGRRTLARRDYLESRLEHLTNDGSQQPSSPVNSTLSSGTRDQLLGPLARRPTSRYSSLQP